ncbi:MAG: M24 family metallopeptidase [Gammaproteobacteria bacterium]|nr:M24 family metallopeptidase [Gammaproteobacteria bacterium]
MKQSRRRFESAEYTARQHEVRQVLVSLGIDLLIVSDPSNMNWLTGYDGWSFYVHQCVVLGVDGELFWYGRCIDAQGARLTTDLADSEIVDYPDDYVMTPHRHPMEYLARVLKARNLHPKTIGVEKDNYYFSAKTMEVLQASLPDASFEDATALVNWQRAVKSPREIEYMKRAGSVIEKVYERIMQVVESGMRKNELVAEIQHASIIGTEDYYGDYAAIVPLIGAGDEASACHMTWDGERLESGSGMFFELAGVHARYHCPCCRTLYLGQPGQKYIDAEKMMLECIDRTLEMFKPGNTCGEVAATFFDTLEKFGYKKDNRCGYPIGLSYPPDWGERTMSLRRTDTTVLQEGMTFHFMPGLWFDDWGFEITESIRVTPEGAECLSNVPRQLLVK